MKLSQSSGHESIIVTLLLSTVPRSLLIYSLAGVKKILVVCPRSNMALLAAADRLGVRAVARVGGAQAIAALAYGTQTIPPVDKIVGPGNRYVTAAKRLVSADCAIDFLAGPTELLILARSGTPRFLAADLLAQAEHDPDAIAVLLTTSRRLAGAVERELARQLCSLPRTNPARRSLGRNGHILVACNLEDAVRAIAAMQVRGAPLIGATAAYGVCLALRADASGDALDRACETLMATRPTAVNLGWALDEMAAAVRNLPEPERADAAYGRAAAIADEDVAICRAIGGNGLSLIRAVAKLKGDNGPVNILTHCNAGWLATVDYGTALAPIYMAHDAGIGVHVWVDETRPRNQGAALTAWELGRHGVPHTVIVDSLGGHLMQRGRVDLCLVGADRATAKGDVCNKVGTYLKALAARDNSVPFYVALPGTTIDWTIADGLEEVPIEEREAEEVSEIEGLARDGSVTKVRLTPAESPAANYGFDITPARLVTAFVTERGVCAPDRLSALYPEM